MRRLRFFVFRDAGAGNRGVGIPGGIWGFRDAGRVCRSGDAGECLAGKGGGAFGGLPGARKTAGHSEDCRTLGGRERGLWELVRVSGAACKRMGGEFRELPEGMDCRRGAGDGCGLPGAPGRGVGRWEEGCLRVGAWDAWGGVICLVETSLDAGKGLRVRRVAGCSGIGLKPGGGVPAFVGNRNRESRAYERRRRGGNIRGAGISYEIPAPGRCLLT